MFHSRTKRKLITTTAGACREPAKHITREYPGTSPCSRANILVKTPAPKARVGYELRYIRCMPIILSLTHLTTLAGLTRSSDKKVTNLLFLAEGLTVQQLPPAVYGDSICWISAIFDKWPLLNDIRNTEF